MKPRPKYVYWLDLIEPSDSKYTHTRNIILRLLGYVHFMAFLIILNQWVPLLGSNGLMPVPDFVSRVIQIHGSISHAFLSAPSIFIFHYSDIFSLTLATSGLLLSTLIAMGYGSGVILIFIWGIYMSFVHVGQTFYGYGWEIQLLETTFLAMFLVPFFKSQRHHDVYSKVYIWLFRWLLFRLMLGSGLIKLRGDPCWRELTCLFFHFETQPVPGPLSIYFHSLPDVIKQTGVFFNHLVELILPFLIFGPRRIRIFSGICFTLFQATLILSGNLSFLNWLTLVACIACFDDDFLTSCVKRRFYKHSSSPERSGFWSCYCLPLMVLVLVMVLSIPVISNLLSPRQAMNTSFDRLHLVNTYGAFGSVSRNRIELIIKGTHDEIITENTLWKEYTFKAKPGNPLIRPPWITPYHYRLDWQLWFAAMSPIDHHPWLAHLVYKLLNHDQGVASLLSHNPFPHAPPAFIKIDAYLYRFNSNRKSNKNVWVRTFARPYLPPQNSKNKELTNFLKLRQWVP